MKRIYPKQEVCMACGLCQVYCLVEHSRSKDLIKAYNKESPRAQTRLRVEDSGGASFALQCRQCEAPHCVSACLTGALSKDPETGLVSVDEAKCMGCWTCVIFCPYGAITPDTGRGVAVKCDLCAHLPQPACVANCPNEALVLVEEGEKAHA